MMSDKDREEHQNMPDDVAPESAGPDVPEAGSNQEPPDAHDHEHAAEPEEPEEEPAAEDAGHEALAQALKGSFRVLKVAMLMLIAFYILKGIFSVDMNETGFKLRFGRIVPASGDKAAFEPGQYYIQFPWEEKEIVSTAERILNVDKEFWAEQLPGEPPLNSLDVRRHGFLVTGDANIVHLKMRVRYRVGRDDAEVEAFLFGVEDPEAILRRMAMASTAKVVSSMPVMDVLQRQGLFENIRIDMQKRIERFKADSGVPLGVELVAVEAIELPQGARADVKHNPTEPLAAKEAFEDILKATQDKGRAAEEGRNEANTIISNAEAEAREMLAEAEGDKKTLISLAAADAKALAQLLEIYERSPEEAAILRDTLYQAAVQDVMDRASDSFVLYDMPEDARREIRFMLGRQPARRSARQEE
jgi:membrane protease subunit HflK